MKKLLLTITLLTTTLFAFTNDKITMQWLENKPTSYAKDFYIWQYLTKNITPKESNKAISQIRRLNSKILYEYIKKSKDINLQEYKQCMQGKTKDLLNKEDYCIEAGLSTYDATKVSSEELTKIINKSKKEYPNFSKKLEILNSKKRFETLALSDKEIFFSIFNQCGGKYREENFNHYFSSGLFSKLKGDKKFKQTIKLIVTNLDMRKAQISLLKLSPEGLDFQSVFHLAINAIRYNKIDLALVHLEDAFSKAYYQMQKDNILFWQYKLTNNKKYLETLSNSWDINIYSLYAKDILKSSVRNIVFDIKQKTDEVSKYDVTNPFSWLEVLDNSKKMDDKKLNKYESIFTTNETLGHLAFVKERYARYKKSYFMTPYETYMKELSENRKALIYAIARQESRFIPTSISSAYAMGTMQIMPFLSKAIAKQLKEPYNIFDQFDPKTNLRYANHHLNYLEKNLSHPLFIAYAYNGGIGFTTRLLKTNLFKKGKYEPYLSMELLPYDETKKYGKKVLANYYIYYNHLNKNDKIKFSTFIKNIKN
ncbi:lytic transglycosylase domain-containing protein [Arcobacteraceae bacterium]|nr:lytic transglycosylase domain-containing protein [Arcobacteraceae bacterium]